LGVERLFLLKLRPLIGRLSFPRMTKLKAYGALLELVLIGGNRCARRMTCFRFT